MFKELRIKNFKCFKDPPPISFKEFNVICGPNSSGKSSLNQAILLLLQNNNIDANDFISNGSYVHFNDFNEIKNNEISSNEEINISLINDCSKECKIRLSYSNESGSIECVENKSEFLLTKENNIYYVSANRIGPEDVYNNNNEKYIGQFGENVIGFLNKYKDKIIDEKYAFIKDPQKQYSFKNEIDYWLVKIIGEKININVVSMSDKSIATYSKENIDLQVRNKNTGSGLSYVITILIMVLSISVNKHDEMPTFIIENPEIHLHPSAQLYLMEFLLFMSKYCQFIIETHSDYIIKETLGNINTQIIKLKNNFIPEIYDKSKGHILPTLSLAEIQWTAFDMPTIDFHILLYSYLLIKLKVKTNGFDDKIRKTKSFKKNKDNYETNYPAFKKRNNQKETLPTFLRNLIHHPESDRKVNIKKGDFDLKLRVSIQLLIDIIKELKL